MGYVRKLPSGNWAATVRTPSGRITETFPLKGAANNWAKEQEAAVHRGDWIDPRGGKTTVGDLRDRYRDGRFQALASRKRDESHWRVHVQPRWGHVPTGVILKPDVSAWVVTMQRGGVGAATIEGALGVLRSVLEQAVDGRVIPANPARGVRIPPRNAHVDRVLTQAEEVALLDALGRHHGGLPCARLMCELMLDTGLRWEEAAALDREHVDSAAAVLHIGPVMERDGTVRPYPKSTAGVRDVPVGDRLWELVQDRVRGLGGGALLFPAPLGGPLRYPAWRSRVWLPAIVGRPEWSGSRGHPPRAAIVGAGLVDPQPTPHDLRHTYGTRLADNGVMPHEIMVLMGHSTLRATERYLHAGPARFANARRALKAARDGAAKDAAGARHTDDTRRVS